MVCKIIVTDNQTAVNWLGCVRKWVWPVLVIILYLSRGLNSGPTWRDTRTLTTWLTFVCDWCRFAIHQEEWDGRGTWYVWARVEIHTAFWWGKPANKKPLGRLRGRWEDDIEKCLKEMGLDGVNWVDLAQNRDKWLAVNMVVNNGVP
jgi:hypothetical protein